MTKRLSAVALCLAAMLAFAGAAQAQQLSYRTAQRLAKRLAVKQVRDRSIVSFHVLKGKRTRSGAFRFPYDDRSVQNVYCTALIDVRSKTSRGRILATARFVHQRCAGIPTQALQIESAVRSAQRAMRGTALATTDALARLKRSLRPCRTLHVPRSRRADADLLVATAQAEALERPNDQILGNFITALGNSAQTNSVLDAGIAGWTDYVASLRALPDVTDPCAAARAWAQHGWAASAAPLDFAALRGLNARTAIDARAIVTAARLLGREGVFPSAVVGFTPRGLLLGLAPRVGITGGTH